MREPIGALRPFDAHARLEVAGIVEPLEFAVTVQPAGEGLAVEATTTVDQRRFGMSSGLLGMIRRPAILHVEALLKRDAGWAAP